MSYSVDDTKSILLHRSVLNKKWEICCLCNVIQLSRFGPLLPKSLFLFLLPLAFLFYFSSQGTITGVNNARGSSGLRAVWTDLAKFRHFGNFLFLFFSIFKVVQYLAAFGTYVGNFYDKYWSHFHDCKGQYWKMDLAIWSYCSREPLM